MSDTVVLTLATAPAHTLVADCIVADRFASLDARAIGELPVVHGGRRARLGDFFTVTGERSTSLRIEGDLERVEGVGTGMAGGEMLIAGNVGPDLGLAMEGGRIDVHGSAGENAGGAPPGAARGMTGGEIVIRGDAGAQAGAAARRGLIVVTGDAGPQAGRGMIAGAGVGVGRGAPRAGPVLQR